MHPRTLGKYRLTGVLGEGAMGTVYKGFDPIIQRPVAVKAIRRHLFEPASLNLSAAERFRNEAQAAGRLTHPGIVGVYEYGEEDGGAFIAMEYVEGHGLNHYITPPARLPERDALGVMLQLLDALHCAHEQGVWHRDIKPNNIIVTSEGRVKIADFGIARIESAELTQMTMLIGSPGFIAPERYTGETPDRRVDIFSCGVLLYQMLTGVAPFAGTDTEAMYKVLHTEPTPPSRTGATPPPDCWDAIVAKALAKRPEDRYATAREFRDALFCAAPWPIPVALSLEAMDGVERRLADDAATVLQVRLRQPTVAPAAPSRPMSRECAEMAELVGRLAAQALAREQQRAAAADVPTTRPAAEDTVASRALQDAAAATRVEPRDDQVRSGEARAGGERRADAHPAPSAPQPRVVGKPSVPHLRVIGKPGVPQPRVTLNPSVPHPRVISKPSVPYPQLVAEPCAPQPPAALRPRAEPPPLSCAPPTLMVPLVRRAPPTPEAIAKAQRVLAGHIGPIARLMVKNAVSIATTREHFHVVLADLAADCVDREQLLAELSRLA